MPALRTFYLIRQVGNQIRVLIERGLADFGVTPAQYTLMNWLLAREAVTSAMLARALHVSPQTMNTLIASLQDQGLVVRRSDTTNKRIRLVSLTEKGRNVVAECNRVVDGLENEFFAQLGATDLVAFRYTLEGLMTGSRRPRSVL